MIALALLLQAGAVTGGASDSAVTVGDTIWLDRRVAIAPGQVVQPAAWAPNDPVEVLGPPDVVTGDGRAVLRYPLVIWRAGRHRLEVPGPLVIGRDGRVDSLAPYVVTLEVASVLPADPGDSAIPPQPRAGIVPRQVTSPWPLVVLLAVAVAVLLPMMWWYRRRGKVTAWPPPDGAPPPSVPLERWAEAGERRAVASAAAIRLRAAIAARAADGSMGASTSMDGSMGASTSMDGSMGASTSTNASMGAGTSMDGSMGAGAGASVGASTNAGAGIAPDINAECRSVLAALDAARFGTDTDTDIDVLALAERAARLEAALAVPTP